MQALESVFTANVTDRISQEAAVDLGEALSHTLSECRDAWPALEVRPEAFVAYLARRMPAGATPAVWLREVFASDLYLAFACLEGTATALRAFDAQFRDEIERALRGIVPNGLDLDAQQILKQRLFVASPGTTPKITTYSGRGPLRRWLRIATGRLALELVGTREAPADEWEVAAVPVASDDPELAYLKARYRAEFKAAFADALGCLSDRERTILAQYHVDALTIDQLGAIYGVHRVTAARWVAKAQAQIRQLILESIDERLGLSSDGLRSVMRLVRSHLSLSLNRVLGAKRS